MTPESCTLLSHNAKGAYQSRVKSKLDYVERLLKNVSKYFYSNIQFFDYIFLKAPDIQVKYSEVIY